MNIIWILMIKITISGGTGGFGLWGLISNARNLNEAFEKHGIKRIKNVFYGWGGAGWGIIDNLFIGGGGFEASGSTGREDLSVEFSYGGGFFDLGYSILNTNLFLIFPSLGIGGYDFDIKFIPKSSDIPFDSLIENPGRISEVNISGILCNSSINVFIFLKKFTGLILRFGYFYLPSSSWKLDGGYRILSHPDFTPSGFYFTINFVFGGFNKK
ncbi:MAG: hypothetical protein ABIM60_02515 [candidate division WOR-3 bacterium]